MTHRIFAAALLLAAVASPARAAGWTQLSVGKLESYANAFAHLPDGRFVRGSNSKLFVQNAFGSAASTAIASGGLLFDPSAIGIRDATHGLLGVGGFGASDLHEFHPSSPAAGISSSVLGSLQNYTIHWWQHPTSGRAGWIIGGGNGASGAHDLTFVSADGTKTGAITGTLSAYSGGTAIDASGNVFAGIYELPGSANESDSDKVFKITADQIDTAVAAVVAGTPAPIARGAAAFVFKFDTASYLAVDSQGRLWSSGYVDYLQGYDPATQVSVKIKPDMPTALTSQGPVSLLVNAFSRNGIGYVAFLATNASFPTKLNTPVVYGYKAVSDLHVRSVKWSTAGGTISEDITAGRTLTMPIVMAPAPTVRTTITFSLSGTAKPGADYVRMPTSVVFDPGDTTKNVTFTAIDDLIDEAALETIDAKLISVSPAGHASIDDSASQCEVLVADDDATPDISTVQSFGTMRVGSPFNYALAMGPDAKGLPVTFTATGLPRGLTINRTTGVISGRPLAPGDSEKVVITATNSAGTAISSVFLMHVEDFGPWGKGSFVGVSDHAGTSFASVGARMTLSVSATASCTGRLTIGTASAPFSCLLDTTSGSGAGQAIARVGTRSIAIALSVDPKSGDMSATLDDGTSTQANVSGFLTQPGTTLSGTHNFKVTRALGNSIPGPEGFGYGSAVVQTNGSATITGRLPDGTAFTTGTQIGMTGRLIVYQPLYAAPGSVLGILGILDDGPHSVSGTLNWTKPAQTTPASQSYKSGWTGDFELDASGGKYRAPAGSTNVLGSTGGYGAKLEFAAANLSSIDNFARMDGLILPPGKASFTAPQKLTVNAATGAFSGTYVFTATGGGTRSISFQGLLVPDLSTPDAFDNIGYGWFLLDAAQNGTLLSGNVTLDPQ